MKATGREEARFMRGLAGRWPVLICSERKVLGAGTGCSAAGRWNGQKSHLCQPLMWDVTCTMMLFQFYGTSIWYGISNICSNDITQKYFILNFLLTTLKWLVSCFMVGCEFEAM